MNRAELIGVERGGEEKSCKACESEEGKHLTSVAGSHRNPPASTISSPPHLPLNPRPSSSRRQRRIDDGIAFVLQLVDLVTRLALIAAILFYFSPAIRRFSHEILLGDDHRFPQPVHGHDSSLPPFSFLSHNSSLHAYSALFRSTHCPLTN